MSLGVRVLRQTRKFNLRPWVAALIVSAILPGGTKAEDMVEIRSNDDAFKGYLERRELHGWQFGGGLENYRAPDFTSAFDGITYETMFGSSNLQLFYVEGGYKLNVGPGSVSFLLGYGKGTIEGEGAGESRTLTIERTTAKVMIALDAFRDEPRFAPYASLGFFQFGVDETAASDGATFSGQTKLGLLFGAGVLVQLNSLEPDVARWAWLTSGLENTSLDVFVTQHGKTVSDADPDTTSSLNWGAGVRIEF